MGVGRECMRAYRMRAGRRLDIGLRVRVDVHPSRQRAIFCGAENLSVQALTSELAEMISSLRVYRYGCAA